MIKKRLRDNGIPLIKHQYPISNEKGKKELEEDTNRHPKQQQRNNCVGPKALPPASGTGLDRETKTNIDGP